MYFACERDMNFGRLQGIYFPGSASDKELACQSRRCKSFRFEPCVGEIP